MIEAKEITDILKDCLLNKDELENGEPKGEWVKAEGVVTKFGLSPERTQKHKKRIGEILLQLPDKFQKNTGGGWSFLEACMDKDGHHWGTSLSVR